MPTFEDELDEDALTARILSCDRCDLSKTRTNGVSGTGVSSPLVMVIGAGPSADEDGSGLPFAGAEGQLLERMLAAIGITREKNAFITTLVKCRPPRDREPGPSEISLCLPWLEAHLRLYSPAAIISLGQVATRALLEVDSPLETIHGSFYEYRGITLMPTYHPSDILGDESLKRPAWEDLKALRERLMTLSPDYAGRAESS